MGTSQASSFLCVACCRQFAEAGQRDQKRLPSHFDETQSTSSAYLILNEHKLMLTNFDIASLETSGGFPKLILVDSAAHFNGFCRELFRI